jgi:flagellar basal-body rod protein FlgF
MIRGLYSAATAMDALEQNQDVAAQNLANAAVPGYRRRGVSFETIDAEPTPAPPAGASANILGTRASAVYTDFEAGSLQPTGNPLDVAIRGNSFFVLDGPNGPLYTRNGGLELTGSGELRSKDGYPVAGTSGRITIPPTTSTITINENGTVVADNTPVGQLRLASFKDQKALVPVGDTLFEAPAGVQPEAGTGVVQQGFREGSNVQIVNEMVSMIAGMRQYEAAQRAFRAISDAIQQQTRGQGN